MSLNEPTGSTALRDGWDFSAAIDLIRSQTDALTSIDEHSWDKPRPGEDEATTERSNNWSGVSKSSLGDFSGLFALLGLNGRPGHAHGPTRLILGAEDQAHRTRGGGVRLWPKIKKRGRGRKKAAKRARKLAQAEELSKRESSSVIASTNFEIQVTGAGESIISKELGRAVCNGIGYGDYGHLEIADHKIQLERTVYSHTDGEYYEVLNARSHHRPSPGGAAFENAPATPIMPSPHGSSDDSSGALSEKEAQASRMLPEDTRRSVIQDILGTPRLGAKSRLVSKPSNGMRSLLRRNSISDTTDTKHITETAAEKNAQKRAELIGLVFGRSGKEKARPAFLPASLPPSSPDASSKNLHVFVDISNILIGFHDTIKARNGLAKSTWIPRQRLSFSQLTLILERNRPAAKRVLVGSDMLESVREAETLGYECSILERVVKDRSAAKNTPIAKHKLNPKRGHLHKNSHDSASDTDTTRARRFEQGVDEILHLKILESVLDAPCPATIVLATGDAAAAEYSDGFLRMVERALQRGWSVEVVAFKETMSAAYRNAGWRDRWDGRFGVVMLDEYAELLRVDV